MIVEGSLHYKDTVMFESAGHVLRYWWLMVTSLHWLAFLGSGSVEHPVHDCSPNDFFYFVYMLLHNKSREKEAVTNK
jgi:hypothetical protein